MIKTGKPTAYQALWQKTQRRLSHYLNVLACCLALTPLSLHADSLEDGIEKPTGIYSSSISHGEALANEHALGALIRVKWNELEPSPGEFNWALIENQIDNMDDFSHDKRWSLAIIAGKESPEWLYDEGDYFVVNSMLGDISIPKFWDPQVQLRLQDLALALAAEYGDDPRLSLVYLPQMTSNGVEGHFNGVATSTLEAAGLSPDKWIAAVTTAASSFALALPSKAIAVEVHTLLNDSSIAETIINQLWDDPALEQRVGAAMWWLSGKESYQTELLAVLREYPGDLYAQVIGRSDQSDRFLNGDYATVFAQAKELGVRYIEPWERELTYHTHDLLMADFNQWSYDTFEAGSNGDESVEEDSPLDTESGEQRSRSRQHTWRQRRNPMHSARPL
ncbi:hypothetical protein A9Q89_09285 [Gammaproteobacteria bacterium 53_120_T64]|nr:hypothetical protein A9Q89_09285 [Gammaproteobacteria bacterium 53_120_T64]